MGGVPGRAPLAPPREHSAKEGSLYDTTRLWVEEHTSALMRVGVIVGVLGFSAYLAPSASWLHIAAVLAPMVLVAFWRWPAFGLLVLVAASALPRLRIIGRGDNFNPVLIMLALLIVVWLLRPGGLPLVRSRPVVPLLAFSGVVLLAFLFGLRPVIPFADSAPLHAQIGGAVIFLLSFGAFMVVAHEVRSTAWLARLVVAFLVVAGIILVGDVAATGISSSLAEKTGALGSLFWVWLVAIAISQAVFNQRLALPLRVLLLSLAAIAVYLGLFRSGAWVSGWLPPLAALIAVMLAGSPRLGAAAVVAGAAAVLLNFQTVQDLILVGDNPYSLRTRLEYWRVLADMVSASPVIGLGPANYYWYATLYPVAGTATTFSSHNNYVDIIVQTGLLGMACFTWFVFEITRLGWRLRSRVPAGFPRAYVYGALGGLAGTLTAMMFGDWAIPFVYNIGLTGLRASMLVWLFLGGLVALEQMATVRASPGGGDGARRE